jgi:hypothetical protein
MAMSNDLFLRKNSEQRGTRSKGNIAHDHRLRRNADYWDFRVIFFSPRKLRWFQKKSLSERGLPTDVRQHWHWQWALFCREVVLVFLFLRARNNRSPREDRSGMVYDLRVFPSESL